MYQYTYPLVVHNAKNRSKIQHLN